MLPRGVCLQFAARSLPNLWERRSDHCRNPAVLMKHSLAQLLSLRWPTAEPTKPQRPLSTPLAAIFLCMVRAASHRAPTLTIFRDGLSTENAERFHSANLTPTGFCFAQSSRLDRRGQLATARDRSL